MEGYPPIAEHGLIGDLQTAALVTTDEVSTGGAVRGLTRRVCSKPAAGQRQRWALPHRTRGGDDYVARQLYFPDTAILITRFMTPDGVGEVVDFLLVEDPQRASDRHRAGPAALCPRPDALCSRVRALPRLRSGPHPGAHRRGWCSGPRPWR